MTTLRDNWSADYQRTNNAGVPDPNGSIYWDFKCVFFTAVLLLKILQLCGVLIFSNVYLLTEYSLCPII
jgi:hypothetical protein